MTEVAMRHPLDVAPKIDYTPNAVVCSYPNRDAFTLSPVTPLQATPTQSPNSHSSQPSSSRSTPSPTSSHSPNRVRNASLSTNDPQSLNISQTIGTPNISSDKVTFMPKSNQSQVVDIIEDFIREQGPKTRDQIVREVEKSWGRIKDRYNRECRTTVVTILSNWNGRFTRTPDGRYLLKAPIPDQDRKKNLVSSAPPSPVSDGRDTTIDLAAAGLLEMHYSPDFSARCPSLQNLPPEFSLSCPRPASPCSNDENESEPGLEEDFDVTLLVDQGVKSVEACSAQEVKEREALKARHRAEIEKRKRKHQRDMLETQHNFDRKRRKVAQLYGQQKEAIAAICSRFQRSRDSILT